MSCPCTVDAVILGLAIVDVYDITRCIAERKFPVQVILPRAIGIGNPHGQLVENPGGLIIVDFQLLVFPEKDRILVGNCPARCVSGCDQEYRGMAWPYPACVVIVVEGDFSREIVLSRTCAQRKAPVCSVFVPLNPVCCRVILVGFVLGKDSRIDIKRHCTAGIVIHGQDIQISDSAVLLVLFNTHLRGG